MGIYISLNDVKVRLNGKVRFTENPEVEGEEDKMSVSLANRLISEAESKVEEDLSPRYAAPFQTSEGKPFASLPFRPTKDFLKNLCENMAVVLILETDFGAGGPSSGDKYASRLREKYKSFLDDHLKIKENSYNTYIKPPLPMLRLNFQNEEADDGFKGMAFAQQGASADDDYPAYQINDPSETFWTVDEGDLKT